MWITIRGCGTMREYFGDHPCAVELNDGATLGELFCQLEVSFKDRLEGPIWNWQKHRFRGPVVVVVGQCVVKELSTPLAPGQEVSFYKAVVGG
jgi:hypothetical protein